MSRLAILLFIVSFFTSCFVEDVYNDLTEDAELSSPSSRSYSSSSSSSSARRRNPAATYSAENVPVAADKTYQVPEDTVLWGKLPVSDADGGPLTVELMSNGTLGTATIYDVNNALFNYVPQANISGTDSLTYRAFDGVQYSEIGEITIIINSINDPPVFSAINCFSTYQSTAKQLSYDDILAATTLSDVENDTISFRIEKINSGTLVHSVVSPIVPKETMVQTGQSLTWTPDSNTLGANNAAFMLRAFDGTSLSNKVIQVYFDIYLGLTINQKSGQSDPASNLPLEFDVVFTVPIDETTFTASDVTQGGTATGVTWGIINSGDNINFTLQTTNLNVNGTVVPTIAESTIKSLEGVDNAASTSTDGVITFEGPSVSINQAVLQDDPTNQLPINFDVQFSRAINPTTFTSIDITNNGSASGITWNISVSEDDQNFTLSATAINNDGTLIPIIAAGRMLDLYGNNNLQSTSNDNFINYDNTSPSVSINQNGGQNDPANILPISFDVVFSEKIDPATFADDDIIQNGTATGITWEIINSGDDQNFTLKATQIATNGTIRPSILAEVIKDLTGNNNSASTSTDNMVTYDNISPGVTIEQKSTQSDPTNLAPIVFDIQFSEAIDPATFSVSDILQTGSVFSVAWVLIPVGDNINFTLSATPVTNGTVIPYIASDLVQDFAGNNNISSTSLDSSVTYDVSSPLVWITQSLDQYDPAIGLPIFFDIFFSEIINETSFDVSDITQIGTAGGVTWEIINSQNDGKNFILKAITAAADGTIVPAIYQDKVKDLVGNLNKTTICSSLCDNSVYYNSNSDDLTVNINQIDGQDDPTNQTSITFDIIFNREINWSSLEVDDIQQDGTAPGVSWSISNSGDVRFVTLEVTSIGGDGTIIPVIIAGKVEDLSANPNIESTSNDNVVTYDTTGPTLTIEQRAKQIDPTYYLPIEFSVTFNEEINPLTFTIDDITQTGTASGVSWNIINSGDNQTFTLQAISLVGSGTVIPSIASFRVNDLAGNSNQGSTGTDNSVTYIPPLFTMEGENAGDKLTYFYGVAPAGDFNNDNYDDVVFGAPGYNLEQGKIYVYSGANNSLLYSQTGESVGNKFGWSVGGGGKYNDDLYSDIIIGAPYVRNNDFYAGKFYIYSGPSGTLVYSKVDDSLVCCSNFGHSLAMISDYNLDTKDEIAIGGSYNSGFWEVDIFSYASGSNTLLLNQAGENSGDSFGENLAGAGDFNNDGYKDVVISANNFNSNRGKVYVYSGFNNSLLFSQEGNAINDKLGSHVSSAGDFNQDSYADIVVSAIGFDEGAFTGQVKVYSGLDGTVLFTKNGENPGDQFGYRVSSGDYNGDGKPDILIGAPSYNVNRGKIYIYSGEDSSLIRTYTGENQGDMFGSSLSFIGDYNNDNKDDIAIGAYKYDGEKGKIYILRGE